MMTNYSRGSTSVFRKFVYAMCFFLSVGALSGCEQQEDIQDQQSKETVENVSPTPEPTPAITPTPTLVPVPTTIELENGIRYQVLRPGRGEVVEESQRPLITLRDESEELILDHFDGEISFLVGSGQGFPGLDLAVRGMQVGEERRVWIPEDLLWESYHKGTVEEFEVYIILHDILPDDQTEMD